MPWSVKSAKWRRPIPPPGRKPSNKRQPQKRNRGRRQRHWERCVMPKLLIVEDNEENRDSLSRRLQRRGYAIVTAEDGNVGLAMAKSEKPDLILMDMNMPELDGWEATRQIKALEGLQDVPI